MVTTRLTSKQRLRASRIRESVMVDPLSFRVGLWTLGASKGALRFSCADGLYKERLDYVGSGEFSLSSSSLLRGPASLNASKPLHF